MNRRNILLTISIFTFIILVGGVSYSYFFYKQKVGTVSLTAGEITMTLSGVSGNQTLSNMLPLSDDEGMENTDYFDFTVNASVDTERIYYELYLLPNSSNTLDARFLKTYLTDQTNNEIRGITAFDNLSNSKVENGKVIDKGIIEVNQDGTVKSEVLDYRLRVWLDKDYSEVTSKTFDFDIYLYAINVDNDFKITHGVDILKEKILSKESSGTCSNITWTDSENDIVYFSGNNTCVDMNYVYYSGKLWRITQIYPDGAMKMITQDVISVLAANASGQPTFYTNANTTSFVYQWLNEDFYDSLYYPHNFIDLTKEWNATANPNEISSPISETTMVTSNVGLLNSYEYYNSYRNIGNYNNGYLNNGFYWWLLNARSTGVLWDVNYQGYSYGGNPYVPRGIRPVIVIKPDVEFTGNGTIDDPFKIIGDKETGRINDYINTRLSGEYVILKSGNNEQVFRIIEITDNKTKVIAMSFADNKANRKFATGNTGIIYGSGLTITPGEDTWYNYLNGTYYPNLESTYGQLFDNGIYYLGTTQGNYKLTVCATATNASIKECSKTNQVGVFNVGLPRYGELFSAPLPGGYNNSVTMWLLSSYSTTNIWGMGNVAYGDHTSPVEEYASLPTIYLKSNVKIISGNGTESSPYVIGL